MVDFKCLNCQKVLGETDGRKLVVNGTQVKGACGSGQVALLCCDCGKFRTWHPVTKTLPKSPLAIR